MAEVTTITITGITNGLFEGQDLDLLAGIDQEASTEKYASMVLSAVAEAFPGVKVRLIDGDNGTHVTVYTDSERTNEGYRLEEATREQVQGIYEYVWDAGMANHSYPWLVERTPDVAI